jgi:hypothetical protein
VRDLRAVPHSSELRRIPPARRALAAGAAGAAGAGAATAGRRAR